MRLRDIASVDPASEGFSRADAGATMTFLPLDRIWHDRRFDPSLTIEFDGDTKSYTPVIDGDVLVPKVAPTFAHGRVAVAHGLVGDRALATSEVFVVRADDQAAARFLRHRLQAKDFLTAGVASWTGVAGLKRVSSDYVRNVPVSPAAWAARSVIADFLDAETARIDALIELRGRQRALLVERWVKLRRRLTGVGPVVPEGISLRRIARLQAGAAFPHDRQGDESGTLPYVKVADLSNVDEEGRIRWAANRVAPAVAAELRSPVLPAGTIVLPKIGAALLTNRRAVLAVPSCLDQNVMGVTVHTGNPAFVFYCLESIDLGDRSTPGPVPLLNEDAALSVRIPWPPRIEQDAIVNELNDRRVAARGPIAAIDRQITLLRERRQALITAAVTGELDVG